MTSALARRPFQLIPLALLAPCTTETSNERVLGIQAMSFANSEWSEPVNLGATVNSPFADIAATLSPDGHSLYFVSNRPGGVGGSEFAEERPNLSHDGRTLFFDSLRPGGVDDSQDIWMSIRTPSGKEVP